MGIMIKSPAKINLSLDVLHKRDDGYHEVKMVMTTIDLADRIELVPLKDNVIKIMSDHRFVPDDERNLAYKAAQILKRRFHITQGVAIYITKKIPVAAGLAGGSSNAAATLKGLNELWNLQLSVDELAKIGAQIGSDVSFCVYGGTALATGRGEIIQKIPSPPPCWVVLAKPETGVSTSEVYKKLRLHKVQHPDVDAMVTALTKGDYEAICREMGNVLESVTFQLNPEVKYIKEQMKRFGADAVLMSGSGPTVFGLVDQEARVQRIYNGLKGFCEQVYAVRLLGER